MVLLDLWSDLNYRITSRKTHKKIKKFCFSGFTQLMSKLNRKQIPVCSACQDKIHKGSYDGLSLKHIKT